jgi:hypothetical protein
MPRTNLCNQVPSRLKKQSKLFLVGSAFGSDGRPLRDPQGTLFPDESHETDQNEKKFLAKLTRDSEKRNQNPSLLLDDLKGLGMYGEFSDDQRHITMPFEDEHRLVTAMRMAEVILNERNQNKRKLSWNS